MAIGIMAGFEELHELRMKSGDGQLTRDGITKALSDGEIQESPFLRQVLRTDTYGKHHRIAGEFIIGVRKYRVKSAPLGVWKNGKFVPTSWKWIVKEKKCESVTFDIWEDAMSYIDACEYFDWAIRNSLKPIAADQMNTTKSGWKD